MADAAGIHHKHHRSHRSEQGFTILGMVFWAIIVCFALVLVMRVFPTVTEYFAVKAALVRIVEASPASAAEVRNAFDRQREIEQNISSIDGTDLDVLVNGTDVEITVAYDKEIEIFDPVFILIKYRTSAKRIH